MHKSLLETPSSSPLEDPFRVRRMLRTPWGDADKLRDRRLPPGRGGDRAAARRDQRERLFAAMVACCERKGFEQTSVADLLTLSGVSRTTFYELFDDKLGCFRAAEEEVVGAATGAIAARLRQRGRRAGAGPLGPRVFVDLVVDQPAAARMCLVEGYGPSPSRPPPSATRSSAWSSSASPCSPAPPTWPAAGGDRARHRRRLLQGRL